MEAIILAGGLGTRLKPLTDTIPKPMVSIGSKPFLTYLLDYLIDEGIHKVVLSVSYKHEAITSYFGEKYKSVTIEYSIENEPLGTGGAIKYALKKTETENILILNGDTFFRIPLQTMMEFHLSRQNSHICSLMCI